MITAQDVREKTFEKAKFGGYSENEVDDFLDELAGDLTAAQKETATLRSKMKVLVEKIEEYRENEDALRLALISAQKLAKEIQSEAQAKADALVADAQAEADRILSDAKAEAEAVTGSIVQQRTAEELRLQKAQSAAAEYIHKFRMVLDHETAFLDSLESSDFVQDVIVTPAPEEPRAIAAPAEEAEAEPEDEGELDIPASLAGGADKTPDYEEAFERAVYEGAPEDTIPDAEEGDDAPTFRF